MPPTTACDLLAELVVLGPAVEGDDLTFAADLDAVLRVLHTGVRAVLAGRRWYGCDGDTGRVVELNPAAPVPDGVTLLAVEGDECWDRIDPAARTDHPDVFVPARAGAR